MKFLRILIAAAAAALFSGYALAEVKVPENTDHYYVVDNAQLLSADEKAALEMKLHGIEENLPAKPQIVIVTMPTLEGEDPAMFGLRVGRAWGVGQKGADNGVVIVLSRDERGIGIAIGSHIEGAFTDLDSEIIRDQHMVPHLKRGHEDYAAAFNDAIDSIQVILSTDPDQQRVANVKTVPSGVVITFLFVLVVGFLACLVGILPGTIAGGFGGVVLGVTASGTLPMILVSAIVGLVIGFFCAGFIWILKQGVEDGSWGDAWGPSNSGSSLWPTGFSTGGSSFGGSSGGGFIGGGGTFGGAGSSGKF